MGPALQDPEVLAKAMQAGANAFRINMSHGSIEQHAANIRMIREVAARLSRPCAILADIMGPKIRVDSHTHELSPARLVTLVHGEGDPAQGIIGITHPRLHALVKKDQRVFMDDGRLELQVESVKDGVITCKVLVGGVLTAKKSLNVPGVDIDLPILGEKDKADLEALKKIGVDWLAISFVRNEEDVRAVKAHLQAIGMDTPVIAKIENAAALENLREIIAASEGVMVARGDLGVEMHLQDIPTIQRDVIHIGQELGKVIIVATQMLESMIHEPRPTRAEVTDVSSAALSRVDALMLSGETANGRYPLLAIQMMDQIIRTTEADLEQGILSVEHPEAIAQTCEAGVYFGLITAAKALITISTFGSTPRILSTYRGNSPVIVACTREEIFHRSTLYYSVFPIMIVPQRDPETLFMQIEAKLKREKVVESGDVIIFMFGYPFHTKNSTNSLRRWEIA